MADPRSGASRRTLRVESLEERRLLAGDTFLVNFQNDEATTPTRYLRDTGQIFGFRDGGLAYGWTSDHTDQGRERSVLADQRLDTLVHFEAGQSWDFAIANGFYEVTVAVGDPEYDDGVHTINVEGVNLFNAVPDGVTEPFVDTVQVAVIDGALTLDQGAAAEKATRINYVHIVGISAPGNAAPATPIVTEPAVDGQIVNPSDVHMEAVGFFDADGDLHKSSDWEIWALGAPTPIYSHPTDGFIEFRDDGGDWPQVHPFSDGDFSANTGEWFGNDGLTSTVLPFQLPDLGAVDNPFTSADLGVHLFEVGTSTVTNVDLYAVRTSASPALLASDYYSGATIDPTATLIQEDFLTPASVVSIPAEPNNFTDEAGDAALRAYLNAAYAGGAGAGDYVFLRLSYASDSLPNGWDAYKVTTSDASGGVGDFPVLSYTTADSAELVWQTLGIVGVERLHTHLGDGVFQGSLAGETELAENANYQLRARFRDDAGSVSEYATREFVTGAASTIFAMDLRDIAASPTPGWEELGSGPVELPASGAPASLRIDSADGTLTTLTGAAGPGNTLVDNPPTPNHESIRLVVQAGTEAVAIGESDLTFTGDDQQRTVFLPAVNLAPGGRLDLWIDSAGGTYFGAPLQTEPDFTNLARAANLNVPFIATEPGFVIEEVGDDYRLPVNIAFVPDPGPNPDDPLYFVTELYGSIQVVTRDGTKHEFATGLLDYNPTGPISGSGEQGLTGIAVQRDETDPEVYNLYVGMLWDNGAPLGGPVHYPKVEKITSVAGGLAMDTREVLLNMQPETQGQSHQISNISIGPNGKLYVHNGDGFDASTALDMTQYRGKVLRMNLDGSAPEDNPFYDASDGVDATDYIYAYGLRNPFGGDWRAADGQLYEVENGPSVDRFAKVGRGDNLGWDGSNQSMTIGALYNWFPATAPVNIAFVQPETFGGSQFPAWKQDHAFVSESGPTYAAGPQANGKRVTEFELDANGDLVNGPNALVEYVGDGRSSVVALAAGPDGLYFSTLYEDSGDAGPTASGARLYRISYVNPIEGDYDIDGDVDRDDHAVWASNFGSNLLLAADGNGNGVVDAGDYTVWRDAYDAAQSAALAAATAPALETIAPATAEEPAEPEAASETTFARWLPARSDSRYAPARRAEFSATISAPAADDALLLIGAGRSLDAVDGDDAFRSREAEVDAADEAVDDAFERLAPRVF